MLQHELNVALSRGTPSEGSQTQMSFHKQKSQLNTNKQNNNKCKNGASAQFCLRDRDKKKKKVVL
jgi:hypothetical protein